MCTKKPWEIYPEIWPTEGKFWTYMRGSIRKAFWEANPIKINFKHANCSAPPEGYKGKCKSGAHCSLSGVWECKSKLEVDHKDGNVPLTSWKHVLPFIQHMFPLYEELSLVTKEAHRVKSYAEKHDLTYEEAKLVKEAIAWEKGIPSIIERRLFLKRNHVENTEKMKSAEAREAYITLIKNCHS